MESDIEKSPLWGVLVEVVHCLPIYKSHKSYVRETILPQKPDVSSEELSGRLGIPVGEAMVILEELKTDKPKTD